MSKGTFWKLVLLGAVVSYFWRRREPKVKVPYYLDPNSRGPEQALPDFSKPAWLVSGTLEA